MSNNTVYELRLRRQKREELRRRREEQRKQRVRQEATRLIAESRQASRQFAGHLTQHFAQNAQQEAERLAQQAERLLQSSPDRALKLARNSRATAEHGMAQACRQTAEWTKEKVAAEEAVTVFELGLQSLLESSGNGFKKELTAVANQLAQAKTSLRRENFQLAAKMAIAGQEQVGQIEQARQQQEQQEDERREVVRGLLQVLTEMGFAVKPAVLGKDKEEGRVVMEGSLPTGRRARFLISLDKKIESDFDGYPLGDRICAKHSDQIRRRLEEQIQAKSSNVKMKMKGEGPNLVGGSALDISANQRKGSA